MKSITSFIEAKLKLKVNPHKSKVDRPWRRKFLGFGFTNNHEPKVRTAKERIARIANIFPSCKFLLLYNYTM